MCFIKSGQSVSHNLDHSITWVYTAITWVARDYHSVIMVETTTTWVDHSIDCNYLGRSLRDLGLDCNYLGRSFHYPGKFYHHLVRSLDYLRLDYNHLGRSGLSLYYLAKSYQLSLIHI